MEYYSFSENEMNMNIIWNSKHYSNSLNYSNMNTNSAYSQGSTTKAKGIFFSYD